MNIFTGLAPFIAFFVVMRLVSPLAGLAAALAISFLLCLHQWWRGERVKVLEVGSLLLFGVLVLYTLIAVPHWSVATVRIAVDGGLFTIVLVSLAIGVPFKFQYAREARVRRYSLIRRSFSVTNQRITAAWAAGFCGDDHRRRGR